MENIKVGNDIVSRFIVTMGTAGISIKIDHIMDISSIVWPLLFYLVVDEHYDNITY
jgi:hypothetical protein